jgi:glucosyl-3-phosphoglycerate synthase
MMPDHDVPWTLARDDFELDHVLELARSTTISVIIPARDESATIGAVIDTVLQYRGLLEEVIVVDDHSSDDTGSIAAHHGARVVASHGPVGKGQAMSAGLATTRSDLVVFLDADVLNTTKDFVPRLVQPLLERNDIQLVKGYYVRPLYNMPTGGGRVNELAARPILSLLFPGLGEILQPLGRR